MFNLIAQAVGDTGENVVRNSCPVSSHKVVSCDSTDSNKVVIGAVVAHNADSAHIGEDGKELFQLVFNTAFSDFVTENSVSVLKNLNLSLPLPLSILSG